LPQALLHNLKTTCERNVVLTARFNSRGQDAARAAVEPLAAGFWRVMLDFGFMETPDVPRALRLCAAKGLIVPPFETSYFLSRETIVPTPGTGMAAWRERLFAGMSRNAGSVVEFFRLPDNAVVELGTRVQI
jgi:KUP system potassium uptake protein